MTVNASLLHFPLSKGLFAAVSFTHYPISSSQEKNISHTKMQSTQCEEIGQESEPDTAGVLG